MTPASVTDHLRRFVALAADLGVADGARLVLRELGIRTFQSMVYPTLERKFEVQFDPVWRWIGRGIRERDVLINRLPRRAPGAGTSATVVSPLTSDCNTCRIYQLQGGGIFM